MLTPDFAFRQTVTVERWLRRDVSKDVFADPVDYPCRVNFARKYSSGSNSGFGNTGGREEKIASGAIWFPAGTRIDAKDRLTFDGKQYTVLSCFPSYDIMGRENHVEVDIQ